MWAFVFLEPICDIEASGPRHAFLLADSVRRIRFLGGGTGKFHPLRPMKLPVFSRRWKSSNRKRLNSKIPRPGPFPDLAGESFCLAQQGYLLPARALCRARSVLILRLMACGWRTREGLRTTQAPQSLALSPIARVRQEKPSNMSAPVRQGTRT